MGNFFLQITAYMLTLSPILLNMNCLLFIRIVFLLAYSNRFFQTLVFPITFH